MAQEPESRLCLLICIRATGSLLLQDTQSSPLAGDILSAHGAQLSEEAFLLPPTLYSCPMASRAVPAPGTGTQRQLLRESWAQ